MINHILIARAGERAEWQRVDYIDGRWRASTYPTALENLVPEVVKMVGADSSAPPDLTVSAFRRADEFLAMGRPETFGLAPQATSTVVLSPLGGLHGDDIWGSVVFVAPGQEPLEQDRVAGVTIPERVREEIEKLGDAVGDDSRPAFLELWVRQHWRVANLAPNAFPAPQWRVDQAKKEAEEAAEAASGAAEGAA